MPRRRNQNKLAIFVFSFAFYIVFGLCISLFMSYPPRGVISGHIVEYSTIIPPVEGAESNSVESIFKSKLYPEWSEEFCIKRDIEAFTCFRNSTTKYIDNSILAHIDETESLMSLTEKVLVNYSIVPTESSLINPNSENHSEITKYSWVDFIQVKDIEIKLPEAYLTRFIKHFILLPRTVLWIIWTTLTFLWPLISLILKLLSIGLVIIISFITIVKLRHGQAANPEYYARDYFEKIVSWIQHKKEQLSMKRYPIGGEGECAVCFKESKLLKYPCHMIVCQKCDREMRSEYRFNMCPMCKHQL